MYLSYEGSLLPILYIIVKWGSYPERSLRALILLVYTSLFTFPFMYILFYYFYTSGSFIFSLALVPDVTFSLFFSFLAFITFAVKLPIYGVHFWLPMAHVEAPTFGSIILAGVLLKLGGIGLLRLSPLISLSLLSTLLLSYLMFALSFVTLICCFQSDLKRLVAYSSVSHIIAIPILLLSNSSLAFKSSIILIFFHGISSPLLFMCVGVIYSVFSTRQIVLLRGLLLFSPLFSLILIIAFVFTMSTPPFPSYVAEVAFLVFSYSLTYYIILPFFIFTFFSIVYNLN
jgi:NADH:ubiquinone oxidoreductase subunit 4 (subunit M)